MASLRERWLVWPDGALTGDPVVLWGEYPRRSRLAAVTSLAIDEGSRIQQTRLLRVRYRHDIDLRTRLRDPWRGHDWAVGEIDIVGRNRWLDMTVTTLQAESVAPGPSGGYVPQTGYTLAYQTVDANGNRIRPAPEIVRSWRLFTFRTGASFGYTAPAFGAQVEVDPDPLSQSIDPNAANRYPDGLIPGIDRLRGSLDSNFTSIVASITRDGTTERYNVQWQGGYAISPVSAYIPTHLGWSLRADVPAVLLFSPVQGRGHPTLSRGDVVEVLSASDL